MKKLVLFSFALLLVAQVSAKGKEMALQLYSIRTVFNADNYAEKHQEIFKQLKQFGYSAVEAASYKDGKFYGQDPAKYKSDLEAAGLVSLSSHTSHRLTKEELESGNITEALKWWDEAIVAHKAAGLTYIVVPSDHFPANLAQAATLCKYHNAIGEKCNAAGIKYGYHSHSFEFKKIEGTDQMWYDYFVENTKPENVFFEMDVYWCVMAQQSPVSYFKKYPGRFTCLHIKDKYELGESGMVGFDAIFKADKLSGMKNFVVELERTDGTISILEGVKRSAEYLNKSKFVKASYK